MPINRKKVKGSKRQQKAAKGRLAPDQRKRLRHKLLLSTSSHLAPSMTNGPLSQNSLSNCCLLIFTRYPEAGKTKTRLIPQLGAKGAAQLQKRLTEKIVCQAKLLAQGTALHISVHYSGGSRDKMLSWLGQPKCLAQGEGDLGRKMKLAFEQTFADGTENAVLIGSDIPDITADLLQQAFSFLSAGEVVIGPSRDGGYYLIGLNTKQAKDLLPLLFDTMRWSTPHLFKDTMGRLTEAGYLVATLPCLRDIDLPADLPIAKRSGLL